MLSLLKYPFKWISFQCLFITLLFSIYTVANAATLEEVQTVFNNNCVSCHSGANPSDNLSLESETVSEANLVGIDATCSGLVNQKRVIVGEPENSVLYLKVTNNAPDCDGVMPPNGNLISVNDRNTIYDWILSLGPAGQFGLIEMAVTEIEAAEDDASLVLTVNRLFGSEGGVSVDFSINDGSALAPGDFVAQSGTLNFSDGQSTQTILIELVDDEMVEDAEFFTVTISNVSGSAILGSRIQTRINLADDDKPGTFLFSRSNQTVNENQSSVELNVLRAFGSSGEVSIDISTSDNSALTGEDFIEFNQVLTFVEGEKSKLVTLTLIDDEIEESQENFNVVLSNPMGNALLGSPNSINILVEDDDGDGNDTGGGTDNPDDSVGDEEAEFSAAGGVSVAMILLLIITFFRKRQYCRYKV